MTQWIISSSILIAAVLLLRRILRGRLSPGIQYALWAIVLLRLLVPVSFFSSALSIHNVQQEAMKRPEVQQIQQAIQAPIRPQMTVQRPGDLPTTPPQQSQQQVPTQQPQQSPTVSEPAPAQSLSLADLALVLWIAGMAGLGIWMLWCNRHFARRLEETRQPMDIPHSLLPVYRSTAVESPCLFGLIQPSIYLTGEAVEDPVVQSYVLTHELTHYRQMDHVWSVLRTAALILHWYNPLVWIAFRVSRQDCEMACDARTLSELGEQHRGNYGRTLVGLATGTRFRESLVMATSMSGSKQAMKERIVILMKNPKTAMLTMVSLILVCALIVGCTFTGPAKPEEPTDPIMQFETLGELFTDRFNGTYEYTPEDRTGDAYEYIVTELDTGISYHPSPDDGLFNFSESSLLLDWENAVSGVNGFWEDSDIMVQIGRPDGSFYIQLHNGTNAHWIYISECDKYVPLTWDSEFTPADPINGILEEDYDAFVFSGRYIDHFGNGSAEEAVANFFECFREAALRARDRSLSGELDYADMEFTGISWYENEDGSITFSYDSWLRPREGQKATTPFGMESWDADGSLHFMDLVNLLRLEDGNWYNDADQDGKPDWNPEIIPTEPTEPREPVETQPTLDPVTPEIEAMFHYDNPDYRWLFMSTQCIFDDPSQIDLLVLLYNGFVDEPDWYSLTPEEQRAVEEQLGDIYTTVDRLPASKIDELLRKYFGVTLNDVQISEVFAYYEGTDSFYHRHGDVLIPEITLERIQWMNDTNFRVYYTQNSFAAEYGQFPMGEMTYGESMVMHLRNVDGIWQPLFNLPVSDLFSGESIPEETHEPQNTIPDEGIPLTREQIAQVNEAFASLIQEGNVVVGASPVSCFFTSYYRNPTQIDLTEFLRYFSSYGIYDYDKSISEEEYYALRDLIGADEYPFAGVADYETAIARHSPVHRIPREAVEAVLMRYAVVPLDQLTPSDVWPYLDEFDCYYTFTSDFGPGNFTCVDGAIFDGYVELYSNKTVLTLVLNQMDGTYMIYSHVPR